MSGLVSILVPVYGVEKYMERCTVSLMEQTYRELEYVFVDDCSPDGSVEVLRKVVARYPERAGMVRIVRHERNQGLAAARNTALENASGKYVMHVDSDDYIDVRTVEKAMERMRAEDADVVIFGMTHVFTDKTVAERVCVPSSPREYAARIVARQCPVCVWGGLYLRSLYMDHGVRAVPGLNMGEDYATKPRVVYYARRIASLDEPLYYYVHYNEGAYSCTFKEKYIDDLLKAVSILEEFWQDKEHDGRLAAAFDLAKGQIWFLLLTSWGLHHGGKETWQRLRHLFELPSLGGMSADKRLMIRLAQCNAPALVRVYAKCGIIIKQLLKK